MGSDAGFDMVPQLSRTEADREAWALFINKVKERYKDDERMQITPNYLSFKGSEGLVLPFEGFKFMRFSSRVSNSMTALLGVGDIILTVAQIAMAIFGAQVLFWNEGDDSYGDWEWKDVDESIKSYEQVDGWDTPEETTSPSADDSTSSKDTQSSLYEVQPIPGKGKGLIALRKITMGTRILIEQPLLTVRNTPPALVEATIARDLKSFTKNKQRQYLSLHNNFPGKRPFSGIFKTNALPCGSQTAGAVYTTICFINHACRPNAHNSWNETLKSETIHATRDIEPGEEITIPYDHGGPSTSRRPWLKEKFGFDCGCSVCRLPPAELEKSDKRRKQIQQLDEAIGDPIRMMSRPSASLLDCRTLLQVLKEEFKEGTDILVARANYDAFQIAVAHGDVARGAMFAERAYRVRLLCEGGDSPDTKRMQRLGEDPTIHPTFGAHSRRWKTSKEQVPRELEGDEFENWLWRQK